MRGTAADASYDVAAIRSSFLGRARLEAARPGAAARPGVVAIPAAGFPAAGARLEAEERQGDGDADFVGGTSQNF
jgi:hypothetical protein